eukprot:CAMPEP_0197537170 /NCGR_PEP_ID=MMETSP1318-20131121/56039_1 /TAXON_ID=552666 /ORGANISM="Partenskyella glossopodia, Strain RCC365" /LENGTH=138 /DNA_ID=CAMNT_0043095279 /DNA_START=1065 /DNA_END=1481 /DNA_ORIENTATION=+
MAFFYTPFATQLGDGFRAEWSGWWQEGAFFLGSAIALTASFSLQIRKSKLLRRQQDASPFEFIHMNKSYKGASVILPPMDSQKYGSGGEIPTFTSRTRMGDLYAGSSHISFDSEEGGEDQTQRTFASLRIPEPLKGRG